MEDAEYITSRAQAEAMVLSIAEEIMQGTIPDDSPRADAKAWIQQQDREEP